MSQELRNLELILIEEILRIHSKWSGTVFTSAQLAKTVAKQANLMASFAKMHSNVKKILSKWCKSSICAHLTTTKLGRSRKTKEVYHFSPSGLDILKRKVITFTIKRIREKNKFQPNILKPREIIIDSILNRLKALKI
ncbi:MAG: hypothetical protein ACTSSJ_01605 [Candidatus Odinarchaeia archaeon]